MRSPATEARAIEEARSARSVVIEETPSASLTIDSEAVRLWAIAHCDVAHDLLQSAVMQDPFTEHRYRGTAKGAHWLEFGHDLHFGCCAA